MKIRTLLFLFVLGVVCCFNQSVSAANVVEQGTYSDNISWTLDEEGTLTIIGSGEVTSNFVNDISKQYKGKITIVKIDEGFTDISKYFWDTLECKIIYLPSTVKRIEEETFYSAKTLEYIYLSEGLEYIGMNAFKDCYHLKEIAIPDSVTEIEINAFQNCISLQKVKLSKNLKIIENALFDHCVNLSEIEIPNSVTEISYAAFNDCNSITKLVIPDSVDTIVNGAFHDMNELKELVIGKKVTKIHNLIKEGTALKKVVNRSSKAFKLDTANGNRTWYVNNKKVTKLAPGKTAVAKGKKFQIKYQLNGGKIKGKYKKTYCYGDRALLPSKVTKKGYTFLGWNYGSKLSCGISGNVTLKPQWILYSVKNTKGNNISITIQDAEYNTKNRDKKRDGYGIRYAKHEDMHDAVYIEAFPNKKKFKCSKTISGFETGETYYIEICEIENYDKEYYLDSDESYDLESFEGCHNDRWYGKRKVTIKK